MFFLFITEDVLLLISGLGLLQAALLAILVYIQNRLLLKEEKEEIITIPTLNLS